MTIQDIESRLQKFSIFEGVPDLAFLGDLLEEAQIRAGTVLFHQDDAPDFFYLVESGRVEEEGKDKTGAVVLRRRAEEGDFVGRWSLMKKGRKRRATATVTQSAKLLKLSAADFSSLLAMRPILRERFERAQVVNRLLAIPLFRHFSEEQLHHVADLVSIMEFSSDQPDRTIYRKGAVPDGFYVVDTGQVLEDGRYVTAGNFFGHEDVPKNRLRQKTAAAETEVRLFRFKPDAFKWLGELQPGFHKAVETFDIQEQLKKVPEFASCTVDDRNRLAGYMGLARYRQGDTLFHQGEFNPTLYFLYEGAVVASSYDQQTNKTSYQPLRAGNKGKGFGQRALFLEEPRDVTIQATAETLLLYLHRADYDRLLEDRPGIEDRLELKPEVEERKRLRRASWMEPDEHTLFQQRRHWFVLLMRMAPPVLLLLGILILSVIRTPADLQGLLRCIRPVVIFLSVAWVIWRFVDWSNDYYIVTDQRAVHEETVLFVRQTRDEAPLDKIQNVNIDRDFVGNLLGYGTLTIDTAARAGVSRVIFDHLGDPDTAQARILEQMSRVQAGEKLEVRQAIREKLGQSVGVGPRPMVPKPVIPLPSEPVEPEPAKPGIWQRFSEATWRKWFWIEKREKGMVTWRKHWLHLLRRIGLPSLVIGFWGLILTIYLLSTRTISWGLVGVWIVVLLPMAFWWWWNWVDWGNDRYAVSDDRLIDTEALPFGFRSKRTETMFDRIQNVSFDIPNPIATFFNYGTVLIYTAGAEGRLDFVFVRDPKGVQREIFRRLTAYEDRQRRIQREDRWADLPDWFAEYDRTRRA